MDIATKKRYIANINKLAWGRQTNCGEFGIIRCDSHADNYWSAHRLFAVTKSKKLGNGGTWTFGSLRKAILAAD